MIRETQIKSVSILQESSNFKSGFSLKSQLSSTLGAGKQLFQKLIIISSPSQPSSSLDVVALIGGEVEEEEGGRRGWEECWSLERRSGEIVPDSEMELTSVKQSLLTRVRMDGRMCVKTCPYTELAHLIWQVTKTQLWDENNLNVFLKPNLFNWSEDGLWIH